MVALPPSYKTAAQDMREASRGLILRLREERLAQKRSQQPRWTALQLKGESFGLTVPEDEGTSGPSFAEPGDPGAIETVASEAVGEEPCTQSFTPDPLPAEASEPLTSDNWPLSLSRAARSAPRNSRRDRITQAIAESFSPSVAGEAYTRPDDAILSPSTDPGVLDLEVDSIEKEVKTPQVPDADDLIEADPAAGSSVASEEDCEGEHPTLHGSLARLPINQQPAAEIPLEAMPSIGQGMRWRLAQLDIRSTNDLAAADADVLSSRLGEIGRLVNVSTWVEMAKTLVSA